MGDLAEKVQALEKRLDDVFNIIKKSFTTKRPPGRHGKQRHLVGTNAQSEPPWVQEIVKCLYKVSTEVRSIKEALGTRSVTDGGLSQSYATATNAGVAPESTDQASSRSGQWESVVTNVPAAPDRNVIAQARQASMGCKVTSTPMPTPTPLTLINPPLRGPTDQVFQPSPESGQQESVVIAPAPPDRNSIAQEPTSQACQSSMGGEVAIAPTPSVLNESPSHTTQHGALPDSLLEDETTPTFCCMYEDISGKLNEAKFKRYSSNPQVLKRGYFKLVVEGLPPLTAKEAAFNQPGKNHFTNFSCRRDSQGFIQVTKGQNRESTFPSFPLPETPKGTWSQRALKEYWENTLKEPPQDMLYIIGDPLFPDIELSPGEGLKRIQRIGGRNLPGIGTTYAYLSFGVSVSAMHGEDAEFRSLNLLRSGEYKCWLIIEPGSKGKLVYRMRQEFPKMAKCSQAIRHLSRLIPPSKLDEWKIPYSLVCCMPGEAIVTEQRAFHQVLNMGPNFALAINILYGSLPAYPESYKFCQKSCDPHAITAAHLSFQEEGPLAEVQGNKRIRSQPERFAVVQSNTAGKKRKALSTEGQTKKAKVAPLVSLFEAVCEKAAFHRLRSLIYSWRGRSTPLFDNHRASTIQLVRTIDALEERSHLTAFLGRFAKVKLAEIIEAGKDGRMRADPTAITNLINGLGWQNISQNQTKIRNYLKEGRQWKKICGSFDGLLCLIPSNEGHRGNLQISARDYQELSDEDIKLFHSLLESNEFIQPMSRIGKTFQASIWSGADVPEFKWESENSKVMSRFSMGRLAPFMKEFDVTAENECEANACFNSGHTI